MKVQSRILLSLGVWKKRLGTAVTYYTNIKTSNGKS